MTPKRDELEEKLFDQKLEEKSDSYSREFTGESKFRYTIRKRDFKRGATWAREQTIKEVLEYVRIGYDGGVYTHDVFANWLEERFLSQ